MPCRIKEKEQNAALNKELHHYGMCWDKLASEKQLQEQLLHIPGLWWDHELVKVQPLAWGGT